MRWCIQSDEENVLFGAERGCAEFEQRILRFDAPGGDQGPSADDEVLYVLRGRGTATIGGEPARLAAKEALARIDPDWPKRAAAQAALPVVLEALKYRAEAVPHVLPATAAVGFAAVRRVALPARDDWHVRRAAAETLGQIGTGEEAVVAALRAAQEDEHFQVCQAAVEALRLIATAGTVQPANPR